MLSKKQGAIEDTREDFHWGKTIVMMALVLSFIGASFYILISTYLENN